MTLRPYPGTLHANHYLWFAVIIAGLASLTTFFVDASLSPPSRHAAASLTADVEAAADFAPSYTGVLIPAQDEAARLAAETDLLRAVTTGYIPPWEGPATLKTIDVRLGPGDVYTQVGTLPRGAHPQVVGRDATSKWLAILFPPGSILRAWIPRDSVTEIDPRFYPVLQPVG